MSGAEQLLKRSRTAFEERMPWEALWDVVYRYIAPERATIFRDKQSPNEIGAEVFDSEPIDGAERMTNLISSGLIPPWKRWLRLDPGTGVEENEREQARKELRTIEDALFDALPATGFYDEMQPMLLDRVVGGTGALVDLSDEREIAFRCAPLSSIAIEQNFKGRISAAFWKTKWSHEDLSRRFGEDALPPNLTQSQDPQARYKADHEVVMATTLEADGIWKTCFVLGHNNGHQLEREEYSRNPKIMVSRWSRIPGTPYGRGPGLRVLSDVRALNKLKELTLKNAAKAVAGVYTAVSDGVFNPWTVTFEPGSVIPVASNNIQEPTIAELPNTARFDVSQFSMGELRQNIGRAFMADQFGSLERTPRSAQEIMERSRILAHDLGSTIARLQFDIIMPVVEVVLEHLQRRGEISEDFMLDGTVAQPRFVSQLAQAQMAADEQNLVEYASIVTEFGQVDPQAGLVLDVHKALRRLGEFKAIHPDDMRTIEEIQGIMQEAAENTVAMQEEGQEVPQ